MKACIAWFGRVLPEELGPLGFRISILILIFMYVLEIGWPWYRLNVQFISPVATFIGASVVAWAALKQSETSRLRHEEQTKADLRRRISESYSKATEHLGSEKLDVRLGGIYSMERVSRESQEEYWPVMETLAAFVRERSRATYIYIRSGPKGDEEFSIFDEKKANVGSALADVAAALSVIGRRSEKMRRFELENNLLLNLEQTGLFEYDLNNSRLGRINLRGARFVFSDACDADLSGADLRAVHVKASDFKGAQLSGADLSGGGFDVTDFEGADLENANCMEASFQHALLLSANLKGACLIKANFYGANLVRTDLRGADLLSANIKGANLAEALVEQSQIEQAEGNARTRLPDGVYTPPHWPATEQ